MNISHINTYTSVGNVCNIIASAMRIHWNAMFYCINTTTDVKYIEKALRRSSIFKTIMNVFANAQAKFNLETRTGIEVVNFINCYGLINIASFEVKITSHHT